MQKQTSKLAKNTAFLFFRQIFIVLLNLYTVRLLLNTLGVSEFATYNVMLSVVMIASFLTTSMNTIIQRFFSFAMGRKSHLSLPQVHNAGLQVSVIAAIISIFGLETVGVWFVNTQLVIEPEIVQSAKILFQFLVLAFVLSIFSTFYSSVIMAHEDMHAFAFISILEAVLRLAAAFSLIYFGRDLLVLYGIFLAGIALIVLLCFLLYSIRKYEECRPRRMVFEACVLKEMLAFGGWTIFGQVTTVSRSHALTILVNQAFSPATVAARAISATVGSQVLTFSRNFSSALHPPIIKAYASDDKEQTFSLIFFGSKITFYLVWMMTLPVIATAPGLLTLWLGSPPAETVLFTQLAMVENVFVAISLPLMTAVRATGNVRFYELSLGTLQALVLLLSWFAIRAGAPAYFIFVIAIMINILMYGLRLLLTQRLVGLPLKAYSRTVLLPVLLVVILSSGLVLGIVGWVPEAQTLTLNIASLLAVLTIFILLPVVIFRFGLSKPERTFVVSAVRRKFSKSGGR